MRRAAKAFLAVSSCIAENGGPSSDTLVSDLDRKAGVTSGAKVTLCSSFAKNRNESASRGAAAYCVPAI